MTWPSEVRILAVACRMSRATVARDEQRQRAERKGKCSVPNLWDNPPPKTSGGGGGDFLKLGDGESRTLVILPVDPVQYLAKPFEHGEQPKQRILIAVYSVEDKAAKVLELAPSTFADFAKAAKKFSRAKWTFTLSREGMKKNTRWSILPDAEMGPERLARLAKIKAPDLVALAEATCYRPEGERLAPASAPEERAAPAPSGAPEAEPVADEDIPF